MGTLKYPVNLQWSDEDKAWIAEVYDLPGCMADGKTQEKALREAEKVAALWIEVAKEEGRTIPPPSTEASASGKFLVRTTKTLHRRLQQLAARENVSLNQLVSTLLAEREAEKRKLIGDHFA